MNAATLPPARAFSGKTGFDFVRMLGDMQYLLGDEPTGAEPRAPASTYRLADYLTVSRGTVRNWLEGAIPNSDDGEMLVAAWCLLTGKARVYVPYATRPHSAGKMRRA